jgi:tRNA A-37 threonylcarbamoyl transferase component Bud32
VVAAVIVRVISISKGLMNRNRRKELEKIAKELSVLKVRLESVASDEQEAFDNLPESFQYAENGSKMEECISAIEDAVSYIDDANDFIEQAIS